MVDLCLAWQACLWADSAQPGIQGTMLGGDRHHCPAIVCHTQLLPAEGCAC